MKYCEICGRAYATDTHHLIGGSTRKLCDEDGLTLAICRDCHEFIHKYPTAATMSKMLGQAIYEKDHTREQFRRRYGRSWM